MPTQRDMEDRLGVTRAQAEQDVHPLPVCPECGGEGVDFVPAEKGDLGYTRIPAHLECQDCGATFSEENAE